MRRGWHLVRPTDGRASASRVDPPGQGDRWAGGKEPMATVARVLRPGAIASKRERREPRCGEYHSDRCQGELLDHNVTGPFIGFRASRPGIDDFMLNHQCSNFNSITNLLIPFKEPSKPFHR